MTMNVALAVQVESLVAIYISLSKCDIFLNVSHFQEIDSVLKYWKLYLADCHIYQVLESWEMATEKERVCKLKRDWMIQPWFPFYNINVSPLFLSHIFNFLSPFNFSPCQVMGPTYNPICQLMNSMHFSITSKAIRHQKNPIHASFSF